MRDMLNLASKLLVWIEEEVKARSSQSKRASVPIRLLILKLALREREESPDLTQSTELALETYQRLSLFAALKQLENSGQIEVISSSGKYVRLSDSLLGPEKRITNEFASLYTNITKKGRLELERVTKLFKGASLAPSNLSTQQEVSTNKS